MRTDPCTSVRIFQTAKLQPGQARVTLWVDGLLWAVIGQVSRPQSPDLPAAFILADVRQMMVDGSETVDMLDKLSESFKRRLEYHAADQITHGRSAS